MNIYHYSLIREASNFYVREENLITHECSEEWISILIAMKENDYLSGISKRMLEWTEKYHPEVFL